MRVAAKGRLYWYPKEIKRKDAVADAIKKFHKIFGYYPTLLHFPDNEAINITFPIETVRVHYLSRRHFMLLPVVVRVPRTFCGKRKPV